MSPSSDRTRLLRGIAAFEAFKGLLALAVALGQLGVIHHDLRQLAAAVLGHIGLWSADGSPALALDALDRWLTADRGPLLLALAGYVTLRFTEAYGLWRGRPWGRRLGAWSGALYVPFELQHLLHRPGVLAALLLLANLAVVGVLAWPTRGGGLSTAFRPRWPVGSRRPVR